MWRRVTVMSHERISRSPDIFAGTSSLLSMPLMMRRNVIGFDTDPRSIDFSRKHLRYVSENMLTNKEIFEIENEISDAA